MSAQGLRGSGVQGHAAASCSGTGSRSRAAGCGVAPSPSPVGGSRESWTASWASASGREEAESVWSHRKCRGPLSTSLPGTPSLGLGDRWAADWLARACMLFIPEPGALSRCPEGPKSSLTLLTTGPPVALGWGTGCPRLCFPEVPRTGARWELQTAAAGEWGSPLTSLALPFQAWGLPCFDILRHPWLGVPGAVLGLPWPLT